MVSTRGVKLKFFEGEKVLCYEPDPTKAKVLYESKVKDVVINKDSRGRKTVEYLIHFRGWNSSWDRCVGEEFILKDTVENRQLQKDLAQKSKLQFGSYLYRKERKKHSRKLSERVAAPSSEDGSCGSPAMEEEEDKRSSSSEEESSVEEENIPLEITEELREVLEYDYECIHEKNKLHKLPAEPNVVTILEMYWKYYANNQKCGSHEKNNSRYRNNYNNGHKVKPEVIQSRINLCQEVLDGLRIYFDFCLAELLLYNKEKGQIEMMQAQFLPSNKEKPDISRNDKEDNEFGQMTNIDEEDIYIQNENDSAASRSVTRRRTLRSYRSVDTNSNGSIHSDSSATKATSSSNSGFDTPLLRIPTWKALPEYIYCQQPPPPSLLYGATHLIRLFVKLPELLVATNMADDKLKLLLSHLESFIDYINEHKEWFGEHCYIDVAMK